MFTFSDQVTMAQQITDDYSSSVEVMFKRDINDGGTVFLNHLGRKFNHEYITTSLVEDQQYYQLPMGVIRITEIKCLYGTTYYRPELIASEEEWIRLNQTTVSGNYPMYYFIRGNNEIGLYPVPSTAVEDGLTVSYEPQHVQLTQDDFTTGTVTVSNGTVVITHSASGFTQQMVGRWLQVTDGTDGRWYRIGSYVSTSVLHLENYYEGISGSGRAFRIGEVMKIPQGYQDAPVYYALERYYLTQGDVKTANSFAERFRLKLRAAKETYAKSTSHPGVKVNPIKRGARWIDLTPPVSYP